VIDEEMGRKMISHEFHSQKSVSRMIFVSATVFGLGVVACGQSQPAAAQSAAVMATSYEVVSVKPAKRGCPGMSIYMPPGRYSAHCVTLWDLIYNAYKVRSFQDHPPGLPGWAGSDVFDVDAKVDDQTATAMQKLPLEERGEQAQTMLQSLLADRFHLRVHYESRIEPIYELVVAKSGPKIKPLSDEKPRGIIYGNPNRITMQGDPMSTFAFFLTQAAGRTVVDKTGLAGNYDVDLKWTPDDQQNMPDAGPTLFTALEEQLGLKLQPAKGPVQSLIVDDAEQPTAN
jgi:uncharacterized protein (TIGR03435 family)